MARPYAKVMKEYAKAMQVVRPEKTVSVLAEGQGCARELANA
jgi:hypothetical protein